MHVSTASGLVIRPLAFGFFAEKHGESDNFDTRTKFRCHPRWVIFLYKAIADAVPAIRHRIRVSDVARHHGQDGRCCATHFE